MENLKGEALLGIKMVRNQVKAPIRVTKDMDHIPNGMKMD